MIEVIIAIAVILAFTLTDAMSDAWMFRDFRIGSVTLSKYQSDMYAVMVSRLVDKMGTPASKWHRWQFLRQGLVICFAAWYAQSWPMVFFGAAVFWILHDGIVNIVGLNRKWFYVGMTAAIDKFFQRFSNPSLAMAIAKFLLLGGSIYLLYAY